jgi:predicted metal-dependent hydrolase
MNEATVERSQVRFGTRTIGYAIKRSSRRSTVSIAIDPAEGVLVTAPRPTTVERLDRLIHAKAPWVIERLKRASDLPPAPAGREFVSGETFLYLGRQHRLRLDLGEAPRPLRVKDGWLHLPIPHSLPETHRAAFVRAAVLDWYKVRAARRLKARVKLWAGKLHLKEPELILVEPRKRWGSASASGAVRLNWRIVQAPLTLVDYVVLHELTHLAYPNHTADFWSFIGRVMPDYEERKARLRSLGSQLEW